MRVRVSAVERQREALRREVAAAAITLFSSQGFASTTVDQIATFAGISRRTFFRYFGSKEDVVLEDLNARGDAVARALAQRPASEDAWSAFRAALASAQPEVFSDAERDLAVGRLMKAEPLLRARQVEKQRHWQGALVPLIRLHVRGGDRWAAEALVATMLACLDTASQAWIESDGSGDLGELYDAAVSAVRAR